MKSRVAVLLSTLLAVMLGTVLTPSTASAATPTVICNNPKTSNAAYCPVHSGAWTYYEAYVSRGGDNDPTSDPDASIKMQILARMGSTSVIIAGVWVVYFSGPRQYAQTQIDAIDGNNHTHNGAWDYNPVPGFNPDQAARGGADISRWPGVSPSAPVGMGRGSNNPFFQLNLELYNANAQSMENALPLYVVFS